MGQEAARLFTTVGADLSGLVIGSRRAESITRGMAGKIGKYAVAAGVAWKSVDFASGVIRETKLIDTNVRKVNSLFGKTGKAAERSFGALRKEVAGLSNEIGVAQSTLADGLYEAISAGVPRANAIDFLRVATKSAIAGVTDTRVAVDGLSTAMNAFGKQGLKAADAADTMFTTVNLGKTEFPQLASNIGKAAPFVAAAGVKFSDFGAAIATMTSKGIKTEETMTDIKAAMQAVIRPTEEMKEAYKRLGVEGWDGLLKRSGSLQKALQAIFDSADGDKAKLMEMLGSVDAAATVLNLAGDNAKDANKHLGMMAKRAGANKRAFDEMNKSVERGLERVKTRAQNVGVVFANEFLPPLLDGLDRLGAKLSTTFADPGFQAGVRNMAQDMLAIGSAIGAGIGFLVRHREALASLIVGYAAFRTTMIAATAAQAVMAAASGSLIIGVRSLRDAWLALNIVIASNPIGALATAVGIAAGAIALFAMNTRSAGSASKDAAAASRELATAIASFGDAELQARQATLNLKTSTDAVATANRNAAAALREHGKSSKEYKTAIGEVKQAQLNMARAQLDSEAANKAAGDAAKDAADKYKSNAKRAKEAAGNIFELKKQLAALADAPKDSQTLIQIASIKAALADQEKAWKKANDGMDKAEGTMRKLAVATGGATGRIKDLMSQMRRLPERKEISIVFKLSTVGSVPKIPMKGATNGAAAISNGFLATGATGGTVRGPGTGRSDSVPALLSNGEEVISAGPARRNRGLLKAINSGKVTAFASGGTARRRGRGGREQSDNMWRSLMDRRDLLHAKADVSLASAERTPQKGDDLKALTRLRGLAISDATIFRKFLRRRRGRMTPALQSEVLNAIASAIRERKQLDDDIAEIRNPDTDGGFGGAGGGSENAATIQQLKEELARSQRQFATLGGSNDIGAGLGSNALQAASNGAYPNANVTIIQTLHPASPDVFRQIDETNRRASMLGPSNQRIRSPRVRAVG